MKTDKKVVLGIENLKKYFINRSTINKAVDGISFNVHEGEIVGLIGESGSGKTTVGRSLLRLYDDVDGFITLNGKIISGKRITRARKKFMHKNIQMIFQDPHASLNGQKTIFSILKEPLVVNGVISDKIKDIKKDWGDIQENFHYSFLEHAKKWELENLTLITNLHQKFIQEWNKKFDALEFSTSVSNDDNFNAYYSYLEEKNNDNSTVINKLYTNTDKLVKFFEKKQNEYRFKVDLDFDEEALVKAKEEYELNLKLSTKSREHIQKEELLETKKEELKKLKQEEKDLLIINKNAFKSFIDVYKNDTKYRKNNAWSSTELNYYFHSKKLEIVSRAAKVTTHESQKVLNYLSFEEVKEFANELEEYLKVFYDKNLKVDESKYESIKLMSEITKKDFKFNISKFLKLSNTRKKHFSELINKASSEIEKLNNELKNTSVPAINQDQLRASKAKLLDAQVVHNKELEKFLEKFKVRIAQLESEVEAKRQMIKECKIKLDALDKRFKQTHEKFIKFFEQSYINPAKIACLSDKNGNYKKFCLVKYFRKNEHTQTYKQLKIELNVYKTNVLQRLDSIKSFDIEKKYINTDLNNISKLLGIHEIDLALRNLSNSKVAASGQRMFRIFSVNSIKKLFIKNTIYKSLEDVGLLKQFAYRYPHEFSGGQRQRIVIARALITNPKVIVADEPIASLDISIQAQVVNLLKDLCKQKNIGMVFIAHDLSMIEYVADKVQIMHLGKIVESGDTNKIYEKAIHPYTNNLFKAIPKISNATEKFQNVSFELSYLEEQVYPNVPEQKEVEPKHFVYGTSKQIDQWLKADHFRATGLKKD
ncbi:ATP-binding cassette domain-containing protein [Mycoplasmopsis alligatoris]|uniref:ABC transporter, ATP-binding protein n=1 Tax=Mycoplasmopsis alligatoris A21JP2 TaxID=747682 RepID=D4XVC0_9BACT|nr:ATP-binding cassette domain-containing protein [Mycoplasmopsis alligatoris]EFF41646.1 ABC transporter, ATP-binding protein [Mycoplasmopsis alligatoris A21JP2]